MYVVYWTENHTPQSEGFGTTQMKLALDLMEGLRNRQRSGEPVSFVGMVSEHPDSVGRPGVNDVLPVGYDWKKRR